jgi:hypothetical protein
MTVDAPYFVSRRGIVKPYRAVSTAGHDYVILVADRDTENSSPMPQILYI